ncbi:methyltransferase, FkbM family [Actinopolyspora alba]|uniref:Methyltransferase, FkbM family n=1 Tax=Actinopolyspora alba TaxID=673379 RepID=A0A1I1UAY4_9ACTN|nr:FkbM family methyltransferase [Actinopolyspora alba]SFD67929.1 methyltransferase, FkbM family [Actinopolyspora alba]
MSGQFERAEGKRVVEGDAASGRRRSRLAALLRTASAGSLFEPETRGLPSVVGTGDVCFDIGAAYGMYSFSLAELVGEHGMVHSFEPQRKPHRILTGLQRLVQLPQLRTTRAAIGSRSEPRGLVVPRRFGFPVHGHAHIDDRGPAPGEHDEVRRVRTHTVDVLSVDQVRRSRGLDRVDFLKIDVEGYEPFVLEGAERTLADCEPNLLLEIEQRHLARYGFEPDKITRWLREMGYGMYVWHAERWVPVDRVTTHKRNYLFTTRRGV